MCFCLEDFSWIAPEGTEQCSTPSSKTASKQDKSSDTYEKMGADETNGAEKQNERAKRWIKNK